MLPINLNPAVAAESTPRFDKLILLASRTSGSKGWRSRLQGAEAATAESRTNGHCSADRGFTLLELLIATAVGAIVLIVINGTYFGALRLHNSTHDKIEADLVLERSLGLVQRDLAGLMLPAGTFSGQFQDTPTDSLTQEFAATRVSPDLYTTSATVDGWSPFSEVQVVAYFLAPATDGSNTKNLVRAVTRNLLPVQTPTTDEQVLLTGVADAGFDYYDGNEWTDTWDSTVTSTLPMAIRFSLSLANRDSSQSRPQPIELVVPVLVATKTSQAAALAQASGGT
jgi:type II secretion system protein J